MKLLKKEGIRALSREELEARIPAALTRVQALQAELEQGSGRDGSRLADEEYQQWRRGCLAAYRRQVSEYRNLKADRHRRNLEQDSPVALLSAALAILREIDDLANDDLLTCHRIESWLSSRQSRRLDNSMP